MRAASLPFPCRIKGTKNRATETIVAKLIEAFLPSWMEVAPFYWAVRFTGVGCECGRDGVGICVLWLRKEEDKDCNFCFLILTGKTALRNRITVRAGRGLRGMLCNIHGLFLGR